MVSLDGVEVVVEFGEFDGLYGVGVDRNAGRSVDDLDEG